MVNLGTLVPTTQEAYTSLSVSSSQENNVPIGYVYLANNGSYNLGYELKKEFWHKGIRYSNRGNKSNY